MGSLPNDLKSLISHLDSLQWSQPREVKVHRGPTGLLGLRFRTVQCLPKDTSITIVILVRNTCIIKNGHLKNLDRIQKINGVHLSDKQEDEVQAIFQDGTISAYDLEVQSVIPRANGYELTLNNDIRTPGGGSSPDGCELRGRGGTSRSRSSPNDDTCDMRQTPRAVVANTDMNLYPATTNHGAKTKRGRSIGSGGKDRPNSDEPNKKNCSLELEGLGQPTSDAPPPGGPTAPPPGSTTALHPLAPPQETGDGSYTNFPTVERVEVSNRIQSLPEPVSEAISDPAEIEMRFNSEVVEKLQSLPQMVTGNSSGPVRSERLDIRQCYDRYCQAAAVGCLWHLLGFKVPHLVVWQPMSRTITLNKGSHTTFGIRRKVKIQEASGDMYTLVESITPGSVAESHDLHVGDWIRSINGEPLQSKNEAHLTKFDHLQEIRLVIQRPEAILQKAQDHSLKLQKKQGTVSPLKIYQRQSPTPGYVATSPSSLPIRPSTSSLSPPGRNSGGHFGSSLCSPRRSPEVCSPRGVICPQTPPVSCQSCGKGPNSHSSSTFPSFDSNSLPREGPVPCVRLIVTGNAANELGNVILSQSPAQQTLRPDSHAQVVKFSLSVSKSDIFLGQWQRRDSSLREQNRMFNAEGYFNNSSHSTCIPYGADDPCVNVELFVIHDENFFHVCSQHLFTKDTFFVIAFDAQKILTNMSSDIGRLERLAHTIQSAVGDKARVDIYGICTNAEDDKGDEVKTMFYANDKQQGKYSVSIQKILFMTKTNMADAARELCAKVFKHRQADVVRVSQSVECVAEVLAGLEFDESHVLWSLDELRQLVYRQYPQYKDLVKDPNVVKTLEQIGCLTLGTETDYTQQKFGHLQRIFANPITLFRHIVKLCIDIKDGVNGEIMMTLSTTGVMATSDLKCLLRDSVADETCFVQCLRKLGVIYDLGPRDEMAGLRNEGDTRNGQSAVFVPYFLEDVSSHSHSLEANQKCLLIRFEDAVPWSVFYGLLSEIGRRPECRAVTFVRLGQGIVALRDFVLKVQLDKTNDVIFISVERHGSSMRNQDVWEFFQQVLEEVIPRGRKYRLCSPCPVAWGLPSSSPGPSLSPLLTSGLSSTLLKSAVFGESRQLTALQQMNVADQRSQSVLQLPPNIFRDVTMKLLVAQEHDWKDLAGRMGKNTEDVAMYEAVSQSTPNALAPERLLIDWSRMSNGTIGQLMDFLTDMERPDVRDIIANHLASDACDRS